METPTTGQAKPDVVERVVMPLDATRAFRWAYALCIELAKEELRLANEGREDPADWPAGQEWDDLVPTSQSIFMRRARKRAGIDHNEFLAPIRDGSIDVSDIYEAA